VKRSPLRSDPAKTADWQRRSRKPLKRSAPKKRSRGVSPASPAQREKIKDRACIVCRSTHVHPAHLIDRSIGGDDDARAVVPLCPNCHRQYDEGTLDLLPYLEPHWRDEAAYAVQLIGLSRAYRRISNETRIA
jgi:hypothetical protein